MLLRLKFGNPTAINTTGPALLVDLDQEERPVFHLGDGATMPGICRVLAVGIKGTA
jgi:hypothetical protein